MRALLVGLGSIGRRHLANLRELLPEADITILRHDQNNGRDSTGCELADRIVYRLDDALDESPDIALIASPSACHLETAIPLAREGVHLLVEKPVSHTLDGVSELIDVCTHQSLVLLVAYNFRFYAPLQVLHEAVRQGRIGRVLGFRAEVGHHLSEWRPGTDYRQGASARKELGGGVLLELSHELDYARWLVGDVESVYSQVVQTGDLEIDVEDLAELTLSFKDGAVGNVHLDMVQRCPARSCRVIGSDGTLTWDGATHHSRWFSAQSGRWTDLHPPGEVDRNEAYMAEMRHFLDCVEGRATPAVTGDDGRQALAIALAAKRSSQLKKAVQL